MTATLADLDFPPEEVLARLDRSVGVMNDRNSAGDNVREGGDGPGPTMTCTCAYAVYDPVTRQCAIASAGHPPPAVVLPDGTVLLPDVPPGPPIGLGTMAYESVTLELPEGSVIALYTDGLIETREADLDAGLERLGAALARPATSLEEYSSHVIGAMTPRVWRQAGPLDAAGPIAGPPAADDDIALLPARTRVLAPGQAAAQPRP